MRVTGVERFKLVEEFNKILSRIEELNEITDGDQVIVVMPDQTIRSAVIEEVYSKHNSDNEIGDKIFSLRLEGEKSPVLMSAKTVYMHYTLEESLELNKLNTRFIELTDILRDHRVYSREGLIAFNRFTLGKLDKHK